MPVKASWAALALLFLVLMTACFALGAITSEPLIYTFGMAPAFAAGWCAKAASWS